MDSYLGDELLVETNHELLRHLENCAACRTELAARRLLRARVRSAVKNSPEMQINSAFVSRLHINLRDVALRPSVWGKIKHGDFFNLRLLTTVAACLLIVSLFGMIWVKRAPLLSENPLAENNQSNQPAETPRPVESPFVRAVETAWHEVAQTAIGDHENCAIEFRLEEEPITLEQAAKKFGRFNKDLDKAVIKSIKKVPAEMPVDKIEFLEAHSCVFQGRRFAHIVLQYRNRVVSVLVTDTDLPDNDGETITNQSDGTMNVAGFRTAHHAVFVVSDLTGAENSIVAQTISPAVRRHIEKAEA
ncbi:MAG: hypothetical protein H0U87_06595 [Acidobacteria bacterium]|nr:hypothetical protein [Acidobacteriota bacterium]